MKHLKYLLFSLILYIYIYNPVFVFLGFGSIKFLLLVSTIYVFKKRKLWKRYMNLHKGITKILFFSIVYTYLIVTMNNGNAKNASYSLFIYWLETFVMPIFLIEWMFVKNNIKIIPFLLDVGFFASLISIFLLLNPGINDFVLGGVITLPIEDNLEWTRCFGLAEGLTSSYGVIQGVFASMALLLLEQNSKKYILYFITLSIAAMINARTGLIPVILTIGFKMLYCLKHRQYTFPIYAGVIVAIGVYIAAYLASNFEETYKYVTLFFTSTSDYITKGETNDYYGALDKFIQFPSSPIVFIFGEGRTLFGALVDSSDIGYVNQIFTGGLVLLISLLAVQFKIFIAQFRNMNLKYVSILLLLTSLIVNFKGLTFCMSESYSRFVMLCVFALYHNKFSSTRSYLIDNKE